MTDNEIVKANDILDKLDFFDGQRAGRELWFNKPVDVQNEDIEDFSKDIAFLRGFIEDQKAEIERLRGPSRAYPFCNLLGGCLVFSKNLKDYNDMRKGLKSEARKEFAERVKKKAASRTYAQIWESDLDEVLAEMESERE